MAYTVPEDITLTEYFGQVDRQLDESLIDLATPTKYQPSTAMRREIPSANSRNSMATNVFALGPCQGIIDTHAGVRPGTYASSHWCEGSPDPIRINTRTSSEEEMEIFRHEQRRLNQIRYRKRQQDEYDNLQASVQHLHQEIDSLKWIRKDLTSSIETKHNPWSIVVETFHFLELSLRSPWTMANATTLESSTEMRKSLTFLEESFAVDIAMGDLCGLEDILQHVLCCSLYFGTPQIKLE